MAIAIVSLNILPEISESDDIRVRANPDEEIVLTYECSGNDFVLSVEGYNRIRPPLKLSTNYFDAIIDTIKRVLGLDY